MLSCVSRKSEGLQEDERKGMIFGGGNSLGVNPLMDL
jgi:hypothetical protein